MSTLIELEEPFKSVWRKGYIQTQPNGRKYVQLFNSQNDTSLISYARYSLSVKEGRFLPPDLEVDHRDDDKTNDDVGNLQLLTPTENKAKQHNQKLRTIKSYDLDCEQCGNTFTFLQREINNKIHKGVGHVFCSRSCSAKFHMTGRPRISEETIERIKQLHGEGKSVYKISEIVGVARNTVMRYW